MQLEDYFDIQTDNDIRLKGTRVGIETILEEFLLDKQSPEAIAQNYSSITLEQVYATILYYLHNKERITKYLEEWQDYCLKSEQEYESNLPTVISKLRQRKLRTAKVIN